MSQPDPTPEEPTASARNGGLPTGSGQSYLWKVRLFGGPILEGGGTVIKRFRSSKAAALLAFLALQHERPCSREALIEALWPDELDQDALANRFRVTLASLRKQLEPEGYPFGSVLDASLPGCVSLRAGATWCDVSAFEQVYGQGDLVSAANLLQGPLLPGIYDGWVRDAQIRYALLQEELQPYASTTPAPAERSASRESRHRLPLYLSAFFGRQKEAESLGQLIEERRLVTITGPGGVGKTRLAVEVCRKSPTPTSFISLTDCVDAEGILETTLRSVASTHHTSPDSLSQLEDSLRAEGTVRLLFDNADHLVEEMVTLVEDLLGALPDLRIVLTSRQALEMDGEFVFRTDPFSGDSSTALCLDRLRQSRPDFTPTRAQAELIEQICARLEGLPLAIELAAAQITTHSLGEIAENLKVRITELKSRRRTIAHRHRSIRLAIESSFEALDLETQRFLSAVSMFSGGFTASAARRLTHERAASDYLEALVSRSLLSCQPSGDRSRFFCLEIIRQLAQERLPEATLSEMVARHATLYLEQLAQVSENDLATLTPLEDEDENISAALREATQDHSLYWPGRTGAILRDFIKGQYRLALRWIREDVPPVDVDASHAKWFEMAVQVLVDLAAEDEARELLTKAREHAATFGLEAQKVMLDIFDALLIERAGRPEEAVRIHEDALRRARELGEPQVMECALSHLSGSLHTQARSESDPAARQELLVRALTLARELDQRVAPGSRRKPLAKLLAGGVACGLGDLEPGMADLEEASRIARAYGMQTIEMFAALEFVRVAEVQGDLALLARVQADFERIRSEIGMPYSRVW